MVLKKMADSIITTGIFLPAVLIRKGKITERLK